DLGRKGRHGAAGARSCRRAARSAAQRGRSPTATRHGRTRDPVRLPAQSVGDDREPTAQLPGLPGVHCRPGPVRPVRHAGSDRPQGLRASRAMASLAPASETLYLVAEDARALNRPREAVDALVALGPDRGFTRGWWVYWDELTTALHLLGDHRAELKQALEGARRFPDNPQVLMTQVRALAALGRADEVMQRLAASVNLPAMQGWTPAD